MYSQPCYYYVNNIDVQLNVDPTLKLRNRVMYQRPLKLYKGVDNIVRFTFKNSDQKPVNIDGWNATFHIISDEEGSIVVSKPATVIGAPIDGVVTVTVTELDLIDLKHLYYNYSLSVIDPLTGIEQVVYADDNYNVRGQLQLLSGHYPDFKPSIDVTLPTDSNTNVTTSTVTADTPTRQQSAHHTAQYYFDDFSGTLEVQATLDSLPPNGNTSANISLSWTTVSSTTYVNQIDNDYENFDGVYTAVRFVITPDPLPVPQPIPPVSHGSVTKILYRA